MACIRKTQSLSKITDENNYVERRYVLGILYTLASAVTYLSSYYLNDLKQIAGGGWMRMAVMFSFGREKGDYDDYFNKLRNGLMSDVLTLFDKFCLFVKWSETK